jgi:hypothetical protein
MEAEGLSAAHSVIYPYDRGLKLRVRMDKSEYRPGQPASATVQVSTTEGGAVPSVIGAVIFDRAVEERARIDQDLRDPFGFGAQTGWWYSGNAQLASLTRADLDRVDTSLPIPEDLDTAADYLLNAGGGGGSAYPNVFGDEYGSESPQSVYREQINRTLKPLVDALDEECRSSSMLPRDRKQLEALLTAHHLRWTDLRDPWGSEFVPEFGLGRTDYTLDLYSPGPDKRVGTDDDFNASTETVPFFAPTQGDITHALQQYHATTGGFVRDLSSLRDALVAIGMNISALRDPWGHPYVFTFDLARSQYTVVAKSLGEGGKPEEEYVVGMASIDYFADARTQIDKLLSAKMHASGKVPQTPEEVKAMLMPEMRFDDLRDPFGRPYFITITNTARYSERRKNNQPVNRDPTTVWTLQFRISSAGPDGSLGSADDFDVATFSTTLSEVTSDGNASWPSIYALFTGNTGGISGVVTDQSGAVIPNAKITATNTYTKTQYETTTDSQGSYLLRDLPPGLYDVALSVPNFEISGFTGVIVRAQEAIIVNAVLRVASQSQTVEVSSESAAVNTSLATTSRTALSTTALAQQATVTPRLRQYFPETLLWQPAIETDARGRARFSWKFADNITTWKVSLIASTVDGRLATAETEVKSFQPFFVEDDPPKVLTVGDRISLPVVVRNYTNKAEVVKVEMPGAEWFRSASTAAQQTTVSAGGNAELVFPFQATDTTAKGQQRVIATGHAVDDAIERAVTVHPNGAELTRTDGRIVSGKTQWTIDIPPDAIAGSAHVDLKIYPGLLSQVEEAIEGMLQRPYGCGEQTISSTYGSVLLLQFEAGSKRPLGSFHKRAIHYVSQGYSRLLNYEDESGGFTYWGRGKPDLALTAYAVRFLHDASPFAPVDRDVIERAREWLFQQQKPDGSWVTDHPYHSSPLEDAILTAYIARILGSTAPSADDKDASTEHAALHRALDYVDAATKTNDDPYLLAGYGLAAIAVGEPSRAEGTLAKLRASAGSLGGASFWKLHANTPFYGWGHAGEVETTALVVQLLDRTGHAEDARLVDQGFEYLIEQKDRYGAWYSTQTTINVIDALLLLASRRTPSAATGWQIVVNGSPQHLPAVVADDGPQVIDVSSAVHRGKNTIEISRGSGGVATAQTVSYYYVPWTSPLATSAAGPLKLKVTCDRTQLAIGEKASCEAVAERVGSPGEGMMIAEIGLPPGVEVDRDGLQKQLSKGGWELSSFEVLPDRVVAYVWPRAGGTRFAVSFTARMAIDALTAPHVLYDYYNSDASVTSAPERFVVRDEADNLAAGMRKASSAQSASDATRR